MEKQCGYSNAFCVPPCRVTTIVNDLSVSYRQAEKRSYTISGHQILAAGQQRQSVKHSIQFRDVLKSNLATMWNIFGAIFIFINALIQIFMLIFDQNNKKIEDVAMEKK